MTAVQPQLSGVSASPSPSANRVQVALMVADVQFGVVLDAVAPVSRHMSALVDLSNQRLDQIGRPKLQPAGATDGKGKVVRGRWALCWVDGTMLRPSRSLAEQGVVDGTKLWLRFVDDTESRTPVIENVTTAVATELRRNRQKITPGLAARIGVGLLSTSVFVVLAVLARWRYGHDGFLPAAAAAVIALALLVAATVLAMRAGQTRRALVDEDSSDRHAWAEWQTEVAVADTLRLTGCAAAAVAAALVVPGPLGAPHGALGATVALAAAGLTLRYTGRHISLCTAVIVLGLAALVTGALRMLLVTSAPVLLASVLLVAMVGMKVTPGLARIAGKIRLPVMPPPGRPWVFETRPYLPSEVVVVVGGRPVLEGPESVQQVALNTERARVHITGMLMAFSILLVIACLGLCDPHAPRRWLMVALAGVVAAAVLLHARSYTDRWQSSILAVTAVTIVAVVALRYILQLWSIPALLVGCGLIMALPTIGLIAAVIVPRSTYTPVFEQFVEWIEYLLLAAVWPLSFWVMDVFAAIRYRS